MPPVVNIKNLSSGEVRAVTPEDARAIVTAQPATWAVETPEQAAAATRTAQVARDYDTAGDKASALFGRAASAVSAGLSDVGASLITPKSAQADYKRQVAENPGYALAGDLIGSAVGLATGNEGALGTFARSTPVGLISRAGEAISRAAPGASLATKAIRTGVGTGVEGVLQETGQIAADLAYADNPEEMSRIAGSISSRYYATGKASALVGGALPVLEHGLSVAHRRLKALKATDSAAPTIADDLATLDRKGLRAAEEAELASIDTTRAPQRAALADDLARFREEMKVSRPWDAVATGSKEAKVEAARNAKKALAAAKKAEAEAADEVAKGIDGPLTAKAREARIAADEAATAYDDTVALLKAGSPRWMREAGNTTLRPDKALDLILNDPKALSGAAGAKVFESKAASAQTALRVQEAALEKILSHKDELAAIHALDRTGRRAAALERIPAALDANRALQRRIDELIATPASERLNAIKDAVDTLGDRSKLTMRQKIGGALAFGAVTSAAAGLDLPGAGTIAPILGAAAGSAVAGKLGGAVAKASAAARERQIRAVEAFMTGTRKARKFVAPLASRVLADARFAPEEAEQPRRRGLTLADHFEARSQELARLVQPGPTGKPVIKPVARRQIADRLQPIALTAPHLADRLETAAVRRVEFLADKLPRTTQIGMTKIPPSEMAIRAFARYVAAADDPGGIEERLAEGTVTPEDREVMRALYPDRMAEITRMVVERLGTLRGTLPYAKRLSLSHFTGVPVDASMDPRILAQLQAPYANEAGTEGGTMAPRPRPAFGSVKKPEGTPAQRRAG